MALTVRVKGLDELRTQLLRLRGDLEPRLAREIDAGAEIVRGAAAASAGGGRLSGSYQLGGAGTTRTVYSDLIYAPVQEFAVIWGREMHRGGKSFHQTVHYRDPAVPRHLYPAFDANEGAVGDRIVDGVARLVDEVFG